MALTSVGNVWGRDILILSSAATLAMAGEGERAIDRLEHALAVPTRISRPLLRIDPLWDPLRGNPRFERLVAKN